MKLNAFDIYIGYVSWKDGGKCRPALVFEQNQSKVTAFNITTKYQAKNESIRAKYFKINDWQKSGLNQQSYIDTNGTITLPLESVDTANFVGRLTVDDKQKLIEFLSGE